MPTKTAHMCTWAFSVIVLRGNMVGLLLLLVWTLWSVLWCAACP